MSLTTNSDFYVAIQDAGINRIIKHVMRQRPSYFNYGSALLAANPQMRCEIIDAAPEVARAGNPIIKIMDPLPIMGITSLSLTSLSLDSLSLTSLGLNYCVQLSKGEIDFHPGNIFTLPQELGPSLQSQSLAIHFRVCAGIGCPSEPFILPSDNRKTTLPTMKLECFCLDLFATSKCTIAGPRGNQKIRPTVTGIEIVDLKPVGLENSIECYAKLTVNYGILPIVGETISNMAFNMLNLPTGLGRIRVSASTIVPNNPAIEDNQLKTFINLDQVELNVGISSIPPLPSGTTLTRTTRPRTRTGVFDFTTAISERSFAQIFGAFVRGFTFSTSGSGNSGWFSATYSVAAHLEGGTIELRSNGTVNISELDIIWDTLRVNLGVDIPTVTIGGFCIIPDIIFGGCILRAPSFSFFTGSPDFSIPLDLSGLIRSEISLSGQIRVFYGVGSGTPNKWQIVFVPTLPFDLDIIDIADTVGDLVENLIDNAINTVFSGAPQWAIDLARAILGPIDDILRVILDIPDDIGEWLLDTISNLGIFSSLLNAVYNFIATVIPPVFELEDPYPVLPADSGLIPVRIPIEFLGVRINNDEMVVEGDIGN